MKKIFIPLISIILIAGQISWAGNVQDALRPLAAVDRGVTAVTALLLMQRAKFDEHEIELAVRGLDDAGFTALSLEVNARYSYDRVRTEAGWAGLTPSEKGLVRATVERQLRDNLRRIAEQLYYALISDEEGQKPVPLRPTTVPASYLLSNSSPQEVLRLLNLPMVDLFEEINRFEAAFRQKALTHTSIRQPYDIHVTILGYAMPTYEPEAINAFLWHLGSASYFFGFNFGPHSERPPSFGFGRGHLQDGVFIMEEELASSPYCIWPTLGTITGLQPCVYTCRCKQQLTASCHYLLRGFTHDTLSQLALPLPTKSPQAREAARCLLALLGITEPDGISERSIEPLGAAMTGEVINHERGHTHVNASMGYAPVMTVEAARAITAGNQIGMIMNEMLADLVEQGTLPSIAREADTDPEAAAFAFWMYLIQSLDVIFNADGRFRFGMQPCLFELPAMFACVRDDGTVDFARLTEVCENIFPAVRNDLAALIHQITEAYEVGQSARCQEITDHMQIKLAQTIFKVLVPEQDRAQWDSRLSVYLPAQAQRIMAIIQRTRLRHLEPFCARAARPLAAENI